MQELVVQFGFYFVFKGLEHEVRLAFLNVR
jgi:hypothetical protein